MKRRRFLQAGAAGALLPLMAQERDVPPALRTLKPMTAGVVPISDAERQGRIERARQLMRENRLDAIFLEPGSSMIYYTGTRWGKSERLFGLVIPAKGELAFVVPGFEEERAREVIRFATDIRPWQEDEDPEALVVKILKDRGVQAGRVGIEEQTRFFVFDAIRKNAPALQLVSATPVTAGCRMIKSPAEIALLQKANDITLAAIKAAAATLHEGMTQPELSANVAAAHRALGAQGGGLCLIGKSTAYPHGSLKPQALKEGDTVLVDAGCSVENYTSDITRTWVFGKPSDRQRQVWEIERKAQNAALKAAQVGAACESVDQAARKVIIDAGFGPGYKVPGLPHRTGHGIGMDGHEWTNFVLGNKTKIQPGMCFSDEPTIAIYGEFGIRLEDCLYVTPQGPRMFSPQSPSIDQPFGS